MRLLFGCLACFCVVSVYQILFAQAAGPESRPAGARPSLTFSRLILLDVQGLWGGQNIFLSHDGTLWVQLIGRLSNAASGFQETRYKLKLKPADIEDLQRLLANHHFPQIQIKDRPGVPDEARPTIQVTTDDGKILTKSKWANDKNADFDAIYQRLQSLVPKAGSEKPVYTGAVDRDRKSVE